MSKKENTIYNATFYFKNNRTVYKIKHTKHIELFKFIERYWNDIRSDYLECVKNKKSKYFGPTRKELKTYLIIPAEWEVIVKETKITDNKIEIAFGQSNALLFTLKLEEDE